MSAFQSLDNDGACDVTVIVNLLAPEIVPMGACDFDDATKSWVRSNDDATKSYPTSATLQTLLEAETEILMPLPSSELLPPLQLCSNLERFELAGTGWRGHEGSSLRGLPRSNELITDLVFLHGLTSLKTLVLRAPKLTDLGPLASCVGLEELTITGLCLEGSHVIDLSPLGGLRRLKTIDFDGSKAVQDIRPLAQVASLTELNIKDTRVSDWAAVQRAGLTIIDGRA